MKIAINTRFLLKDKLEGVGWYTHELTRRMVLKHPETTFYLLFDRPFDKSFIYAENVKPVLVRPPARHPTLFKIWFEYALPRVFRKIQPKVFFSPDGFCSLRSPIPTVLTIHDLSYLHYPDLISATMLRYYHKNTPKFCQKADTIITVSKFSENDIHQKFPNTKFKTRVVYNAPRDLFFQNQNKTISNETPYFLYVGSIHPRKNLQRTIQAFELFYKQVSQDVDLLIVGRIAWKTTPIMTTYRQSIARNNIQFKGSVPDSVLAELMNGSIGVLYPSLFEGFGFPLVEAMASKVPFITSNLASMPEIAGNAGILVDPTDIDEIYRAMEKIYQDDHFRQTLIDVGVQQVKKFNWDLAAAQVYQVLKNAGK